MVGKVKHVRHKLHQQAVKLHSLPQPGGTEQTASPLQTGRPLQTSREEGQVRNSSGV